MVRHWFPLSYQLSASALAISWSGFVAAADSSSADQLQQLLGVALFGIEQRLGRIGRPRALVDADRRHRAALEHAHQLQPDHLEQRQERHDQAGARLDVGEQVLEPAGLGLGQALPSSCFDPILDRNLLGWQVHLRALLRALDDGAESGRSG